MAKHFPRKYEELSLDSWNSQKKKKRWPWRYASVVQVLGR